MPYDTPFEHHAVISGIGQSQVGRRLYRNGLELTIEAALEAIEDAGLTLSDIDGIATYPGDHPDPGFAPTGVFDLRDALGIELRWFLGARQTSGQFGPIFDAMTAVACGRADHVVCFRTVTEATAQAEGGRAAVIGRERTRLADDLQWFLPFGAMSAINYFGQFTTRYLHEFGATADQLAWIPINSRNNAARNPKAIYRDPIDLEDYRAGRMISTPLRIYDCDVPADGSTVVVVSRADATPDLRAPVRVAATGGGTDISARWDQWPDLTAPAAVGAARRMWARTDLTPADVDVAELYDGFTLITAMWLEALGFCGHGEAADFVDGGQRIALDGELPLNTQGGQQSGGRLHGFGFLHEACVQLRGDAGERQVTAAPPEVAVAAAGGGHLAGCVVLTTDR